MLWRLQMTVSSYGLGVLIKTLANTYLLNDGLWIGCGLQASWILLTWRWLDIWIDDVANYAQAQRSRIVIHVHRYWSFWDVYKGK